MDYLYPHRNVYLYCLPYHPVKKPAGNFRFLSIKKVNCYLDFKAGETILLMYRKSKYTPSGIIGFCTVAGSLMKTSDIPKKDRKYIFDRNYLQLPVEKIQCGVSKNIINEDVLYSLPSMNEYKKFRVYNELKLIRVPFQLLLDINDYSDFWYVWNAERCVQEIADYENLYIHLQREKIEHKDYKKLVKDIVKCSKCETTHNEYLPFRPRFFELHENKVPPLTENYQKRNFQDFVALCPSCHRKEHELIISHIHHGYGNYTENHLMTDWNSKYFNKEYDLQH